MGQKFWSCVRDVCAVRGDCYSAPLHVQFKPVTPDPVVRNSVLTHWYFRISNWFFFSYLYLLSKGHQVSHATKSNTCIF